MLGVHGLSVDSLQPPVSVRWCASFGRGPRCRSLRRAYTLLPVDMQTAQRTKRRIRAGGAEHRDAIDVAQFAPWWNVDPLVRFSRPPMLIGIEP
jgi:hypothetical protein